jgi:ferric-dicitrate binding protein FerR (iron transport regulator)
MLKNNPESANHDDKIRVDVDQAWSVLKGKLENDGLIPRQETSSRRFVYPIVRMAAAILVLAALGISAYLILSSPGDPMKLAARTDLVEQYSLTLPDGSVVDLNARSKIQYTLDKDGTRMVKLSGEAYFNIARDPDHPFIIRTGQAVVRVTGTSFSVRSDPASGRVEVFVESGSVQLYQANIRDKSIMLESGNMGILDDNALRIEDNNDENYLSWKTRKLTFRQTHLGEVARVLNRTYKKEIIFGSEEIENCLYTGTFDRQPVDSVVRVIQVAFGLEVDQNRNSYVLSGEGCN